MKLASEQLGNKIERQGDDNISDKRKNASDGGERQQKSAATGIGNARNRQIAVQNGLL